MIRVLRQAGHDVRAVAEDQPGIADARVMALATSERRVLLTNDKDFAELAFERRFASAGVVLLRLRDWDAKQKAARLLEVLAARPDLHRNLLVVLPRGVRSRALDDPG